MTFKEINIIRKEGRLEEALIISRQQLQLDPSNPWCKRALAWVLIDFMKVTAGKNQFKSFLEYLGIFVSLEIPVEEELILTNAGYWITKVIFNIVKNGNLSALDKLLALTEKLNYSKPSEFHSGILRAVIKKAGEWDGFFSFIDWWNLENLQDSDFKPGKTQEGKIYMSLAERAFVAYAKKLEKESAFAGSPANPYGEEIRSRVQEYIPKLEKICDNHPEFTYPPYYLARFYLGQGDKNLFLEKFLPFARKKLNNSWVWDLLSDAQDEQDCRLACLCKALLQGSPEKMLVRVREKLAGVLIEKEMYAEAKEEILKILSVRDHEGWRIPDQLESWITSGWFETSIPNPGGNENFYREHAKNADELLYSDTVPYLCVITGTHRDKPILYYMHSRDITGNFSPEKFNLPPLKPGDFVELRLDRVKNSVKEYFRVLTARTTNKQNPDLYREITGKLNIINGNRLGFVGDVFLGEDYIRNNHLLQKNTREITVRAVPSYDMKKQKWGWKAIGEARLAP